VGTRVPITTNVEVWREAVDLGEQLLWLHTYAERFANGGRGNSIIRHPGIEWTESVVGMPASPSDVRYDGNTQTLHVGSGAITGIRPEVWQFEITGFDVARKWFEARTAKGVGRASGERATPLDLIRPDEWRDEWYDEALELLTVLTRTIELQDAQQALLGRVLEQPLLKVSELPRPLAAERKVPDTMSHTELSLGD
jgi:hypothetical protein